MRCSFLLAGVAALVAAVPAVSQDISSDTIIVTATRAPAPADQLAPMLDVIDRAEIEASAYQSVADALARAASIQTVETGALGAQASAFTRGTNSNHTLVLYDGIRLNEASTPARAFDFGQDTLGDAARIEAVRGPLSSVYGSDAVGGVVNIIPRLGAPDGEVERFYDASVGEWDSYRVLAGLGGGDERLAYALSAEAIETEGFDQVPGRFALATGDRDGGRSATLTAQGRFQASDRISLEGLVRARQAKSEFDSFSAGPFFAQRGDDPDLEISRNDYLVWRAGGVFATRDDSFEARARVGQVRVDRAASDDGARTDVFSSERLFLEQLNTWRPLAGRSAEAGWLRAPALSFGVQYEDEEIANDPAFSDPLARGESRVGAFAVGHAGLGERLFATASARHDEHDDFGGVDTGGIGLVLDVPEARAQLTASFGTSFRAPTLTERFSESAFEAPNPDLEPERGESWEVGARATAPLGGADDGFRAGASYFETEVEDLIVFMFDPVTFVGTNVNVGVADISGYEAFLEAAPDERFSARIGYAYTDARNAETGARLARRAAHVWTAGVSVNPLEQLSLGAEWRYVGRRPDTRYDDDGFFVAGGRMVPGFETVRLTASWTFSERAAVYAALSNALDESYEQPDAFAGAPRALRVGLRGRF